MTKIMKIVSDGKPLGTHVYLEDGSELFGITEITWNLTAGSIARVNIMMIADIDVELIGEYEEPKPE
jgi:hypothetical protein